jgi:hypothetical protein
MVRCLRMLEEGGQGRDGLSRPRRRVEEENASALDQLLDLVDRSFLSGARPVGEERADYGRGAVGGRTVTFSLNGPRNGA